MEDNKLMTFIFARICNFDYKVMTGRSLKQAFNSGGSFDPLFILEDFML